MPTPNRYLNEIQRADARAERHMAATKRGARNAFVPAPDWLISLNVRKWGREAVLISTPAGEMWIPLSAVRGIREVNGKDVVVPFGYTCDADRREIAAWWMEQNFGAEF